MTNNTERADLAQTALEYFCKDAPGHTHCNQDDLIDESDMADLVTNLMHLCKRGDMDWDYVLRIAVANYEEEKNEPNP